MTTKIKMKLYKELSSEEEKSYRQYVDENQDIQTFLKKVSTYHPVIKDEICKRLKQ